MTKKITISTDGKNWTEIWPMDVLYEYVAQVNKVSSFDQPKDSLGGDIEDISCLRVDLYDCIKHPDNYIEEFKPIGYLERSWIPQTIGDQIWILYKFKSIEDRINWENSLTGIVKEWLDRDLIRHALSYGWSIRDHNGFVVK